MKSLLTLIFLLTVSAAQAQTIRYVTPTGTTPAASATTSWATSTTDLQGAINASQSGDQVWVARSRYQPADNQSFALKNGVAIYGGFEETETDLSQRSAVNPIGAQGRPATPSSTTLLGNGSRVITNPSGLTTTAVLDGFVITGGGSVELGGGMYNDNSSPTLRNCLFSQNTVMSMINGGVFCEGGAIYNLNSNPVLTNCLFSQNAAMGDESNNAGAIYNEGSSLTLTNCAFSQNSVTNGFNNAGGAMFNQNSRMVLTNCLFSDNTVNGEAATYAGAIYNVAGSRMVLTNCSFRGNVASSDNAITYGGAFYSVGSGTSLVMLNCSMQGNVASRGGAIFNAGSATLTNCVVFGNGGSRTFVGAIPASYSLFDRDVTGYSGANNLTTSISPFVSTTSDALAANSAAINVGSPLSQTAATGPYSETALPTTDLAGNPRQIGCRVDMGAMEYQQAIYPTRLYVKADASGSGSGLSWDDAFTDLQRALTYPCSQSLTEIWVATGTYQPASGSSFSMLPGVAIYGGFAGGEGNLSDRPAVNPLSGNPLSATLAGNGSRVINNPASLSLTTTAVLDGFVITGGGTVDKGGGMYNESGSPTLRNCLFRQNTVSSSGTSYGGAVYLMNSAPVFTNCVFSQNTSSGGNSYAGAMFNDGSSPVLTNCTFSQNGASGTAQNGGGAIYNAGSSPVLINCSFSQNTVSGGALSNLGGAIANQSSNLSLMLVNCSFRQNAVLGTPSPGNAGGAIHSAGGSLSLINCSLQGNQVLQGGAISNFGSTILLINSVLWGNGGSNTIANNSGSITARYSLFESGVTGFSSSPTNITGVTISPFATTSSVALADCSPAINAGNPASVTVASSGVPPNPYSETALPQTELAGNPRIVGSRVDMGAVEYQGTPNYPVAFTLSPASGTAVCMGSAVSVPVGITGTVTGYQWYKGGSPIASQTVATLFLTNLTATDAGSYSVVVTGACNSVTSTAFSLTVNALPSVTVSASSTLLTCTNPSLTLTAQSSTTALRWSDNSTNLTLPVSASGTYSVTATGANGCSVVSNSVTVGQDFSLPGFSVSNALVCPGSRATLQATGCPGTVRWPDNSTGNSFTTTQAGPVTATCTVGSCSTTATGTVNVQSGLTGTSLQASGGLSCAQPSVVLTALATGTGLSYSFSAGAVQSGGSGVNRATVSVAGSYSVLISDVNGCTATATASVTGAAGTPPNALLVGSGNLSCTTPTLTLTALGGSAYQFSGPGIVSQTDGRERVVIGNYVLFKTPIPTSGTAVVNKPGRYVVVVTGEDGCTSTAQIEVTGTECR